MGGGPQYGPQPGPQPGPMNTPTRAAWAALVAVTAAIAATPSTIFSLLTSRSGIHGTLAPRLSIPETLLARAATSITSLRKDFAGRYKRVEMMAEWSFIVRSALPGNARKYLGRRPGTPPRRLRQRSGSDTTGKRKYPPAAAASRCIWLARCRAVATSRLAPPLPNIAVDCRRCGAPPHPSPRRSAAIFLMLINALSRY